MRIRNLLVGLLQHLPLLAGAFAAAWWISPGTWTSFVSAGAATLSITLFVSLVLRIHEGIWRYAEIDDSVRITLAMVLSSAASALVVVPRTQADVATYVVYWLASLVVLLGARVIVRLIEGARPMQAGIPAVVVGAGDAGEMLVREVKRNPGLDYDIKGFVDDDRRKVGRRIHSTPVLGTIEDLPRLVALVGAAEILVAVPTATEAQRRAIVVKARECNVPLRTVPALADLVAGRARIGNLQRVQPEDLLLREPVDVDPDLLRASLRSKRVLITGAAGSIGSELSRQVARIEPASLVLVDRAESPLYFIDQELRRAHPGLDVVAAPADITDAARIAEVFSAHEPEIVYHAAAYKHVPMMEAHPLEAIRNNVIGTETVARAAMAAGTQRFVLISTDKAVRPVGVMGMTKRVAEDVLRALHGPTVFVAVRFGNVLGSEGSVLPLFERQLSEGRPVTVTDPEATRYFMLIGEAAQLVLQAGAQGGAGDVLFLDMGEPVRIGDLADRFLRLSGLEPEDGVSVEVVGLRPGERLNEELLKDSEELMPSGHDRVLLARSEPIDVAAFSADLERLRAHVQTRDAEGALAQLKALAKNY